MGSLTQVVNGEYIGADKYVIEDAGDGKSTVVFSPDNVLKEGTPVGAELLNEIQKNGLYYLAGTHRVDGQESIYDCTLIGIDTFDFTQLNVLFKPDTKPTQSTIKLNISGEVYTLSGLLQSSNQIGLVLIKSELIAYTWGTKMELVNNFTGGEEKALSGEMGTNLMGAKQDGSFPLSVAEVGKNYRAGNGKLYKCITAYNGTEISLPNANFTELSILENSNRLDNLIQFINKSDGYVELNDGLMIQWFRASTSTTSVTEVNYPKEFKEGAFQVYATYDHPSTSAMAVAGVTPYTKTSCRVVSRMIAGSGSPYMRFLAIGY